MVDQIVTLVLARTMVLARAWALGRMEPRAVHVGAGLPVLVWVRAQGLGSVVGLMLGQVVGVRVVGPGLGPAREVLVARTRDHSVALARRRTLGLVLA
jgi:hypothetical protein